MTINRNPFSEESEGLKDRFAYLILLFFLLFLFLMFRLWYLQIIKGPSYRNMSDNNRTRIQDILPSRGLILDRKGRILVDNYPAYDLSIVREDISDFESFRQKLTAFLGLSPAEAKAAFAAAKVTPAFKPILIQSDLDQSDLVSLETHRFEFPGILIQVRPRRKYMYEMLASHVIGYLGEISPEQLKHPKYEGYRMGDLIGRYGLEAEHEINLNGRRGWRQVEVAASGRVLRVIKQVPPSPGNDLVLTLDLDLQRVAEEALGDTAGAIAVLDPRTGEVLALVSKPSYNQEDFIKGISPEKWAALVNNPKHPLQNRAVSGQYMPGSIFKIVSALAALGEGLVTPETTIFCNGGYKFGNRIFHCWKRSGHGIVNLEKALVESCDVYFYDIGRRINIDRLAYYSKALGLGTVTGVGLRNEKPGLVPTVEWKKKRFNQPWMQGENLSVIIGQGFNLVTPLQMARLVATVVNGGKLFEPSLVSRIQDSQGKVIKIFSPKFLGQIPLSPKHLELVKKALVKVVQSPRGTGRAARLDGIIVGGKTGTAQVVSESRTDEYKDSDDRPYEYRDHAWFVAFAPAENPRIALAVIAEHSGHGGSVAAPVAKKILEAFFEGEKLELNAKASTEKKAGVIQ